MNGVEKTRQELLEEIEKLRAKISELEKREETTLLLLQNPSSIIIKTDDEGHIIFANTFALRFFSFRQNEFIGKKLDELLFLPGGESQENFRELIDDIKLSPDAYLSIESENVTFDGTRVWIEWTIHSIPGDNGSSGEIIYIGNDITRRRVIETELRNTSMTDFVTGLLSRKVFIEKFELERYRFSRNGNSFILLFLSIIDLQEHAEHYGPDCGDNVIKRAADIIVESLRRTDIIARWAGEEIIMLLPDTTYEGGISVAGKIYDKISDFSIKFRKETIPVTPVLCVVHFTVDKELDAIMESIYLTIDKKEESGNVTGGVETIML